MEGMLEKAIEQGLQTTCITKITYNVESISWSVRNVIYLEPADSSSLRVISWY